jgi:addiction module HigA family antidote
MENLEYGYSPTHLGELLKEEIEYRNVTQTTLAKQMGIPYTVLNDILNERRPLTANTAMLFEAVLGISADLLMRMQLKYNMQVIRKNKSFAQRLAKIRQAVAML